jgi:transglutaminase-like putative cysteine protease
MRQLQLPPRDPRRRGWKWWQRSMWVGALLVAFLPPLSAALGVTTLMPEDVVSENNLLVAVLMGWCMLACMLVTGALMGPPLGPNRPVPLTSMLLPELSLFGLLNIVSVDTLVMISFITYVAAALYLISYEVYLTRRPYSRPQTSSPFAAAGANPPLPQRVRTAAMQYALACGAWLAIFAVGAGLFYGPLTVLLPWSFSVDFARSRQSQQEETRDWRDATRVMELRGGANPVSERPVMRVRTREGESRPLWRGRVYERYAKGQGNVSHWEVFIRPGEETYDLIKADTGTWTELKSQKSPVQQGLQRSLPALPNDLGKRRDVVEQFQLMESFVPGPAVPVFTSGEPVAVRSGYRSVALRSDGTARLSDASRSPRLFSVRSQVTEPNLAALSSAPGLSPEQLRQWKSDRFTAPTAELPRSAAAQRLRAIAAGIEQEAQRDGRPLRTPYQKATAIGRYLIDTCEYSLASPAVPPGADSVVFFLTESRLGACDMFASSMALLLRAMDVPTRIASGFLQPDVPESPDGRTFLVRERNAHAWVEYYIPELGWISFDPTEGTRVATNSLGDQVMQLLQLSQWKNQARFLLMPALGVLLLVTGGVWMLLEKRNAARPATVIPREHDEARERIRAAYRSARGALARHVPARRGQTPHEYEAAVLRAGIAAGAKQEFSALTYLLVQTYYTATPPAPVEQRELRASVARLRRAPH